MCSWTDRVVCAEMWRRVLRWLIAAIVLIGLNAVYRSDNTLFRNPAKRTDLARTLLSERLAAQHVALLYTADNPPGEDWVSGRPARIAGTRSVKGHFGRALEFDGRRRTFVILPLRWSELGDTFSLGVWLKLDGVSQDQEILFTRDPYPIGFKLDRGHLSFFLPSTGTVQAAEYVFTNYGQFVHVSAVVEAGNGRVRLYEGGILKAELKGEPFALPNTPMFIGAASSLLVGEPVQGAVDEVLAWRRALSDQEVADWAASDKPALERLAQKEFAQYRHRRGVQENISHALKLIDRFNPTLYSGPLRRAQLPEINLVLSKADARFFSRADQQCRRSGRRTSAAAQPRRISIIEHGHGFSGQLRLDGSDTTYPESLRRSFILEPDDGDTVLGLRRLRLQPPESAGWLGPLLETRVALELGILTIPNGLCRLAINGEFVGLYYYEDYATLGVPPGLNSRRFQGTPVPQEWSRLGCTGLPHMGRDTFVRLREEVETAYRRYLEIDYTSPLSSREISFRLRTDKNRLNVWPLDESPPAADRAAEAMKQLSASAVLGSNPSPFFVLHDLQLPSQLPGAGTIAWSSSRPDLIDEAGLVSRPTNDAPQGVTLTARLAGSSDSTVQLEFRVMPRVRNVPAVFLWAAEPLDRLRRVDCSIDYYPNGAGDRPQHWFAAQDGRAGVALRGNSTMRQNKKSYGLRLSEPHGWWGSTNLTKIRFVNPWRDPTFLHNWFFYSIFSRFADTPDRIRHGIQVTWVELFANGNYLGLFEASPSVRAEWLGLADFDPDDEEPAVLYKHERSPPSLSPDAEYLMRQVEPSRLHGEFMAPALDLQRLIMESPRQTFVQEIDRWLDLDNVTDFHLLLNFSENYNGFPFHFAIHDLLARDAGADSKFFLVPYDFDNTYGHVQYPYYHSIVFERLLKEYPGYEERLAARWRELRGTALGLNALEREVRTQAQQLAGYVAWDDWRWETHKDGAYAERVDDFVEDIRQRIAELDALYGYSDPAR